MHKLFLSSVRNWLNMATVLNMPELAMGSESALIYICLTMPGF